MRSFRHINFEILKFFYTRRKCTLQARLENGEISGEKRSILDAHNTLVPNGLQFVRTLV